MFEAVEADQIKMINHVISEISVCKLIGEDQDEASDSKVLISKK